MAKDTERSVTVAGSGIGIRLPILIQQALSVQLTVSFTYLDATTVVANHAGSPVFLDANDQATTLES